MDVTELLLKATTLLGLGMTFVFLFLGLLMIAVKLMAKYIPADQLVVSKKPDPKGNASEKSEINPSMQLLYYKNLVDVYANNLENNRYDFEIKILKIYNDKYKDSVDFNTMLAGYYKRIGDKQSAIYYLEQALALDYTNKNVKDELNFLKNN
jgi:oxaloacetate decarboxylase gamma subunit